MMQKKDFFFNLPKDLIAFHPSTPRDHARLLHIPKIGALQDTHIYALDDLLHKNDLLIFNDSRVLPARIYFYHHGKKAELTLLRPRPPDGLNYSTPPPCGQPGAGSKPLLFSAPPDGLNYSAPPPCGQPGAGSKPLLFSAPPDGLNYSAPPPCGQPGAGSKPCWYGFGKPGRLLKIGDTLCFSNDDAFTADIINKDPQGILELNFNCNQNDFYKKLDLYGSMPLPPYIKRKASAKDREDYQTIFAKKDGAVAAPTAGLHFSESLLERLQKKGIAYSTVTLHVGAGTFLPVREENLSKHHMHQEWGEVDEACITAIKKTQNQGGRIISVGTTTLRILESAFLLNGNQLAFFSGNTDIFITPGFSFRVVDALITNFHLPASTLFMLVSAFSGLSRMHEAYHYAIKQKYRFYSYGDACFLEGKT